MPIDDAINLVGEGIASLNEATSIPLPSEPRQYVLADTIGKLKACNSKWQITTRQLAIVAGTPTEIVPDNGGRVLFLVFVSANTLQLYPQGTITPGPGVRITVTDQMFLINYDTFGPLTGIRWFGIDSAGQILNIVEVIANQ